MSENENCFRTGVFMSFIVTAFLCAMAGIFIDKATEQRSYKQGQIDALSGKIRYKLVEQSDKSTQWVEVKEAGHE